MTQSFSSQMTAQMKAMHEEQFGHDLSCSEIFDKMQADPGTYRQMADIHAVHGLQIAKRS